MPDPRSLEVMPRDNLLIKHQWNELATAIEGSTLPPNDFTAGLQECSRLEWKGLYPSILHREPPYGFAIQEYRSISGRKLEGVRYTIVRRPGGQRQIEWHSNMNWVSVVAWFKHWLDDLKRELETPDLWAAGFTANPATFSVPPPVENSPFTAAEQQQLRDQLDQILGAILTTQDLTDDQARIVRADLDYLKGAVGRIGRWDWLQVVIGTVGGWVLTSALPPDKVSEIWAHFAPIMAAMGQAVPLLLRP
jgi:hypothetical protein